MSTAAAAPERAFNPADIAYVAVFAALIAALALVPSFALGGIPFSFAVIGIALAGLCLGPWRGTAAVALYVVAGLAGLPVFAGGSAGLGVLFGMTGGYLVAYVACAFVIGLVARWAVRRGLSAATLGLMIAGCITARLLVMFPLGVLGMARAGDLPLATAAMIDVPFIPLDIIKFVVASLLALSVHKAFPRLLGR